MSIEKRFEPKINLEKKPVVSNAEAELSPEEKENLEKIIQDWQAKKLTGEEKKAFLENIKALNGQEMVKAFEGWMRRKSPKNYEEYEELFRTV